MNYRIRVNLIPSCFQNTDSKIGAQSFKIDDISYSLEFDGRKLFAHISKPMQEDCKYLETCELTSSYLFNLEEDKIKPKRRNLNNKKPHTI